MREIRSIIRISTEKMASATGISQERLQQIEAGEKATITELREIAMQLRTSTLFELHALFPNKISGVIWI